MGAVPCVCQDSCDKNDHSVTETVPPTDKQYDVANLSTLEDYGPQDPKLALTPVLDPATLKSEAVADLLAEKTAEDIVRFPVQLSKTNAGGGYGLAHAALEAAGVLMVMELRPEGVVAKWNEERAAEGKPEFVIKPGDRIVGMTGAEDLSAMRTLFRQQESVEFLVERWPSDMNVVLERQIAEESFGLKVEAASKTDDKQVLVVLEVTAGVMQEWNTRAAAAKELYSIVTPGTEIVSINGNTAIDSMQEMLLKDLKVDLSMRRPEVVLPN